MTKPHTLRLNDNTKQPLLTLAAQINDTYLHDETQLSPQTFINAVHSITAALVSGEEQCRCGEPMWPTTINQWATDANSTTHYAQDVTVECSNKHTKHLPDF